jgi:hypothetical protein
MLLLGSLRGLFLPKKSFTALLTMAGGRLSPGNYRTTPSCHRNELSLAIYCSNGKKEYICCSLILEESSITAEEFKILGEDTRGLRIFSYSPGVRKLRRKRDLGAWVFRI